MNNIIFEPREQGKQAKYRLEGLTWVSNNTAVIPRDSAGNIRMEADSAENPLVVIDPVTENILTRSALKVIDTQFQYYKFPVQVRASGSLDLNVDLALNNDPVYARYKPSENWTIAANGLYAGILLDKIVEGLPQTETNGYYITKEIKESGVDLRLRAKISHYFLGSQDFGTAYFSIMRSGPNKPIERNWRKGEPNSYASTPIGLYDAQIAAASNSFLKQFKTYAEDARNRIKNTPPSSAKTTLMNHFDALLTNIPADIDSITVEGYRIPDRLRAFYASPLTYNNLILKPLEDQYLALGQTLFDYVSSVDQAAQVTPEDAYGKISPGNTQIVYIDEIIPNSEFDTGDVFAIGGKSGQPDQHTIWAGQTYMVVTNAAKTVDEWNNPV